MNELEVRLDRPVPARLEVGAGNAIFLAGACAAHGDPVSELELRAGGRRLVLSATLMPRPDLARDGFPLASGFWGIVPVPAKSPSPFELQLRASAPGGSSWEGALASVDLEPAGPESPPAPVRPSAAGARIAICMATYEPPPRLLRRQLDSIRAQTRTDWICVISDDCSSSGSRREIEAAIDDDERFVLSVSPRRMGIYKNFERALRMAPVEVDLVAFADQDDRWDAAKLERLGDGIGSAQLIYSDARVVSESGRVLAETYWTRRRNNWDDLGSLAIANTITGAASMFRRELVDLAVPFPQAPGELYHDHWVALLALARGEVRYLDEPLYDYVQHEAAALGHARANALDSGQIRRPALAQRVRRRLGRRLDWRELYFLHLCRIELLAHVLLLRADPDPAKRRVLERLRDLEAHPSPAWLALRSLRRLRGRNETLGIELGLLRAVAWRHLTGRAGGRPGRHQWHRGAAVPPLERS